MSRLKTIDPAQASGRTKELLEETKARMGLIPNMTKTMANSPAVLEGYLKLSGALEKGKLSPQLREQIAITVAEANSCQYCLSAHTAIGKMVGVSEDDLMASHYATASDPKIETALNFVNKLVMSRGEVPDGALESLRQIGYDDEEIAELVGQTVLNIFTNYYNKVAGTEVDFPRVPLMMRRAA